MKPQLELIIRDGVVQRVFTEADYSSMPAFCAGRDIIKRAVEIVYSCEDYLFLWSIKSPNQLIGVYTATDIPGEQMSFELFKNSQVIWDAILHSFFGENQLESLSGKVSLDNVYNNDESEVRRFQDMQLIP